MSSNCMHVHDSVSKGKTNSTPAHESPKRLRSTSSQRDQETGGAKAPKTESA